MEKKPKYEIGQTVFFLDYAKAEEQKVTGIIALFAQKEVFMSKDRKIFTEFKYFFEERASPKEFGWKSESEIFPSKESLIKSL